jgi:predicted TIM-barrel fold metal-dependent hydrolase
MEGINGFVRSLFEGYKAGKEKGHYHHRFEEMKKTNILFDVDEVEDMLKHAKEKEDYETILDHMYRFDACERGQFGYYKGIEKKIIHRFWEDEE